MWSIRQGWWVLLLTLAWLAAARAGGADTAVVVGERARHVFRVELADTDAKRQRGLMYRRELAEDAGMLFHFERVAPVSFWMKNTYLSLDMLFLAGDGRIVHIHERAVPESERPIAPPQPVLAVLEVLGGTAQRLGIKVGDRVDHPIFVR
ncbi:MAG: DUF192 domain-containing protein [Alphaproteobacteria bacterium]|nr:DUF192 domain-containing protein [Alphaproteobacteria bacterium]